MRVISLGVGEAFDECYPNNSHLVMCARTNILLDCGYSVPQELWRFNSDPDFLDVIYISHQHWDHIDGLNKVLMRAYQDGRCTEKPIIIICPKAIENYVHYLISAPQGRIPITVLPVTEHETMTVGGLEFSFASTNHSVKNLAVRISNGKSAVCYSGDGNFTKSARDLYREADILIQATYFYDEHTPGHACIKNAVEVAEEQRINTLMLTHLQRDFRRDQLPHILDKIRNNSVTIIIPKPGNEHIL